MFTMADIADELRHALGVPDRREYQNTPRNPEEGADRPCGSAGAHRPHRNQLTGSICWGIMPLWPCALPGRLHDSHHVGPGAAGGIGGFYCPGQTEPPTDMIGPPYSHDTPLRGEGWDDA